MKNYFKSTAKEIVPIIIGILIALFINDWNDERKEKKYFSEMLVSIEHELKETQVDIDSVIILQKSVIDTLVFYLGDETLSLAKIMNKTNGISVPTIRIHSWKALSNSKIELLSYKNLSSLANIEEDKDILNEKSKYLMNFLYNNIGETDRNKKSIMVGLLSELISTESSITLEIDELKERIEAGR